MAAAVSVAEFLGILGQLLVIAVEVGIVVALLFIITLVVLAIRGKPQ